MARTRLGSNYRRLWTASVVSNFGDGVAGVAYPWLASAVTRDPVQIALIGVANRLPWLLFSLPAGVLTDRLDRRKVVASMDVFRFALTPAVGLVVFAGRSGFASPADIAAGTADPHPQAVSLRQAIIPDRLLGRVNSVYRLLAWGAMPAGMALGEANVSTVEPWLGRETALRTPFYVAAVVFPALFFVALPRLNTPRIEEAHRAGRPTENQPAD